MLCRVCGPKKEREGKGTSAHRGAKITAISAELLKYPTDQRLYHEHSKQDITTQELLSDVQIAEGLPSS